MAQINYKTLCDQIKARLHDTGISSGNLEMWINAGRDRILREVKPDWAITSESITAVSGQAAYNLTTLRTDTVMDVLNTTEDIALTRLSVHDINLTDPDRGDSPDTVYFALGELVYVSAQPTSASVISLVSSSSSDTTQIVRVRGTVGGVPGIEEAKTLTGTVAVATSASFSSVDFIGSDSAPAGSITATSNAGAVTVVVIPTGDLYKEMQQLILWGTPADTDSYVVYGMKNFPRLKNNQDPTRLPGEWSSLLLDAALVEAHRWGYEFSAADSLANDVRDQIERLKSSYNSEPSRSRTLNRPDTEYDRLDLYNTVKPAS